MTRSNFMSRERMRRWQVSINNPKRAKRIKNIVEAGGGGDGVLATEAMMMHGYASDGPGDVEATERFRKALKCRKRRGKF